MTEGDQIFMRNLLAGVRAKREAATRETVLDSSYIAGVVRRDTHGKGP